MCGLGVCLHPWGRGSTSGGDPLSSFPADISDTVLHCQQADSMHPT